MKKVTLITCVLALLSAMTIIGCANPAGGGSSSSTTESIDGTYKTVNKDGTDLPPKQTAQFTIASNKITVGSLVFSIEGTDIKDESGKKIGTWGKNNDIYTATIILNPEVPASKFELFLKKIPTPTPNPDQGGGITAEKLSGKWINNTIGNSITVKEDGKSGTMPNPKDHGQTTVTFTIVNNDIMIDTEKFGTVLSLENNMLTVNLPNIGNVSGIHVYTREEENKQPIPENIAPANCVGKWKNAAYNITLTVDKSGKQGNMTYPDGTGSKEVPFTIEGNQINVDNKKFGTVISVKDGKMYAKTLVPSAPIEAKLTSVFYFAKQILR